MNTEDLPLTYILQSLPHPSRRNCWEAIRSLPDGIVVEIKEMTRSIEQNRLLWPLLALWEKNQTLIVNGEQAKVAKEVWKVVLLHSYRRNHGKSMSIALGLDGDLVPLGYSSKVMGIRDFADFLTFCLAETGNRKMALPPRVEEDCWGYIREHEKRVSA